MPSSKKLRGRQKKASKKSRQGQSAAQSGDGADPGPPGTPFPSVPHISPGTVLSPQAVRGMYEDIGAELPEPTGVLTPGAIHKMYDMLDSPLLPAMGGIRPVLQVLRLEQTDGMWYLDLSDGENFFGGLLHPSLASLVKIFPIENFSIIRITDFLVKETSEGGGRRCFVIKAEIAGPNPRCIIGGIGRPSWLPEDVLKCISAMDPRATSYVSSIKPVTQESEEMTCLLERGLLDLIWQRLRSGFEVDCVATMEQKDDTKTMMDWLTILSSIIRMTESLACLEPVLKLILDTLVLGRAEIVPDTEFYGSRRNYFMLVARLLKIFSESKQAVFPRSSDTDALVELACGAVFWHLDKHTNPECHRLLHALCVTGSEIIRDELFYRETKCQDTSDFTKFLLSIANMRVCPGDSTFCSSIFLLIPETPIPYVRGDLMDVLEFFVKFNCVDRDMICNIVELPESMFSLSVEKRYIRQCFGILECVLNPIDGHHGSWDRRMSIAVEAGLVMLVLKLEIQVELGSHKGLDRSLEVELIESTVPQLERCLTRGSKSCLSMARVDLKTYLREFGIDIDRPCSYRANDLVESARALCARRCTCCAELLAVGRIFRCDNCGTVYCSPVCQTKDWTIGGHKETCKGGLDGREKAVTAPNTKESILAQLRDVNIFVSNVQGPFEGRWCAQHNNELITLVTGEVDEWAHSAIAHSAIASGQRFTLIKGVGAVAFCRGRQHSFNMESNRTFDVDPGVGVLFRRSNSDRHTIIISSEIAVPAPNTKEFILAQLRAVNKIASNVQGPFEGRWYATNGGELITIVTGEVERWVHAPNALGQRFTLVKGVGTVVFSRGRQHSFDMEWNRTFDVRPNEGAIFKRSNSDGDTIIISCKTVRDSAHT